MKRILAVFILFFIIILHFTTIVSVIKHDVPQKMIKNKKQNYWFLFVTNKGKISKKVENIKIKSVLKPKSIHTIKSFTDSTTPHNATWYKTDGTQVHREYPTAAYNSVPRGTKLLVTNPINNKKCIVEVTDRNGMGRHHIDLSYSAFGYLADHSNGKIKVYVKTL
jgi:rare lipoprotein A (peptidoglycan hydrolase)